MRRSKTPAALSRTQPDNCRGDSQAGRVVGRDTGRQGLPGGTPGGLHPVREPLDQTAVGALELLARMMLPMDTAERTLFWEGRS
jgi:hypothetical protein